MALTLSVLTYRNQPPNQPIERRFSTAGGSLGRDNQNDLVLPDPGRVISRKHAQIQSAGSTFQLTNLGQNPIDINGRPLANGETATLSSGDRLQLGDYCLVADIELEKSPDTSWLGGSVASSTPGTDFDIGGSLLPGTEGRHAFGIDLGGGAPEPAISSPVTRGIAPLANDGTQRDGLPGFLEPLPSSTPIGAGPIPDDYDLLDGLDGASDPFAAPSTPAAGPPLMDATDRSDPFDLLASAPGPAASPPVTPLAPGPALVAPQPAPSQPSASIADPPTSRGGAPAADSDQREAMRKLLEAAGVPELIDYVAADPQFPAAIGELLREAVAGLLKALAARALTKRELRVDMTMLSATENNPLKFCPNSHEALMHLLAPQGRAGYLQPTRAIRDSYDDLQAHNLAVMAGMRAALLGVLQRFDPVQLEQRLESNHLLDKLMPANRKARMWDLVAQQHATLVREAQDEFDRIFGRAFRSAYDDQVRQIRASASQSPPPSR